MNKQPSTIKYQLQMITQQQVSEKLLWPLWRCITDDYKSRYKREVWDHFENAVRSAAYTGKLRTYLANFQQKIPCDIEAQYIADIISVIDSGCDSEILDWLRDETTYLVMLTRLRNQDRRDAYLESIEDNTDRACPVSSDPEPIN